MANTAQDRERAIASAAEKHRLARLSVDDIGAYGRSIGIIPRYLAGSTYSLRNMRKGHRGN